MNNSLLPFDEWRGLGTGCRSVVRQALFPQAVIRQAVVRHALFRQLANKITYLLPVVEMTTLSRAKYMGAVREARDALLSPGPQY